MISINLNDIAVLKINDANYQNIINWISEGDAANLLQIDQALWKYIKLYWHI